MSTIGENTVIEWVLEHEGRTSQERILWVDRLGGRVVVIALEDGSLPVWKDLQEVVSACANGTVFRRTDPFALYADPGEEFLKKHLERRDRAWGLIEDIVRAEPDVYYKELRGRLVKKVVDQHGVAKSEIYRLLRRYWIGGKIKNALLPDYQRCGGPGVTRVAEASEQSDKERPKRGRPPKIVLVEPERAGVNVDANMLAIFDCAFKLYYDTSEKNPLRRAFGLMLDKYFNVGSTYKNGVLTPVLTPPWEQPTYGQFHYWYHKQCNLQHSIIKREGQRKYDLEYRPLLGNSTQMAFGPGAIYQIDATIGDIFLVSCLNRSWIIGRPVIYFVIDVFSRMCAGLYVGLEGPSWVGAMMAIANATTDKVAFCAEYGITITPEMWPTHYLPVQILGDGGELIGYNADNLVDSLDITVANCPPYRADLKGIVEQRFNRAKCKSIAWLPGAVQGKREPGGKDHRLDATLDLHEFTKIIIITTLQYNLYHWMKWYEKERDLIRDEVQPIPINLWEWGIAHRTGQLRERSPEVIKLSLMPKSAATVTERGIHFEGAYFDCERARREQWYIRARNESRWKVPISYDPRRSDTIYLRIGGKAIIEPCTLIDRDQRFINTRVEEIQQYHEMENIQETMHEGRERQSDADLRAQIDQVERQAKELTKVAMPKGISNKQRTDAIKGNRTAEKELNRARESFALVPTGANPKTIATGNPVVPEVDEPRVVTSLDIRRNLLNVIKNSYSGQR